MSKFYLYRNSLDDFSIDLWNDVLSCYFVECDSNFDNMQLEKPYKTLIDAMLISSNYFTKRKKSPENQIVG